MARKNEGDPRQTVRTPAQDSHYYANLIDVPWDIQKYYHQRYSIFSKYDDGIWMTEDAWFGVTPEPVANKIADHVAAAAGPEKCILIDCFAGVGGNVIAFAQNERWTRVYAIEKDKATLECAKHNAEIYGVQEKISWYLGDCFEVLRVELQELKKHSIIFASPPWGGPSYKSESIFDLFTMQPYTLSDLMGLCRQYTEDIVIYLPRTSDVRQLAAYSRGAGKLAAIHYCIEGASK
ncbi:MAG: hypothetical protein Q9164_007645, partial [Protoblastenia rupestris]